MLLKARPLLSFALFFLILAGYLAYQKTKAAPTGDETSSLYQQALEKPGRPAETVTEKTEDPIPSPAQPSVDCKAFQDVLETLPLQSLMADLKDQKIKIPAACKEDPKTDKLFTDFQSACLPEELQKSEKNCIASLFQYRARRIQLWARDQDNSNLTTEVLIQKFFGLIGSGDLFQPGGAEQIREIAEELKKRLPDSAAPYRLQVVSYLIEPTLTPEQNEAYDEALREARARDPKDWQLFEVELLKNSRQDPLAYEDQVENLLQSNPRSPIGLYHAGCIAWRRGDRSQAQSYFHQAWATNPDDPRFRDTLQKAGEEPVTTSVCAAALSFSPESF